VPAGLLIAVAATSRPRGSGAAPLVLPLALYLLTFVIVFSGGPLSRIGWPSACSRSILALVGVVIFDPVKTIVGIIGLHCASSSSTCSSATASLHAGGRRAPSHIFYLWMGRRDDRRHRGRSHRTPCVQLGCGISILIAGGDSAGPGSCCERPAWPLSRVRRTRRDRAGHDRILFFHPEFEETKFNWIVGSFLALP